MHLGAKRRFKDENFDQNAGTPNTTKMVEKIIFPKVVPNGLKQSKTGFGGDLGG